MLDDRFALETKQKEINKYIFLCKTINFAVNLKFKLTYIFKYCNCSITHGTKKVKKHITINIIHFKCIQTIYNNAAI